MEQRGRSGPSTEMPSASLHEIYESIDGEGFHVGQPVIIVRFAGCNLSCSYCDTPQARQATDLVQVSTPSGEIKLRNPIDVGEIVSLLAERFSHRTVLLTGGEPLLQAEAAVALGLALRLRGFAVHLESNGTLLPQKRLATAAFDFVSMDLKLPSSQGGRQLWREHERFLEALSGVRMAVKIVFDKDQVEEVMQALNLVRRVNPQLPVFLQPVHSEEGPLVGTRRILEIVRAGQAIVPHLRLSLQMHKVLGLK